MTRKLIDELREAHGMKRDEAGVAIEQVFGAVRKVLADTGRVQVPGFGTFKVAHRDQRQARNPRTGEPITIAARSVVTFKEAGK